MKASRLEAIRIARVIREAGFDAYFAGGCVRDTILGVEPNDWDITTNARPEQIEAIFGPDALPIGKQFGVICVKPGVEVATYRNDGQYSDGRRPDAVTYSDNVEEDVKRRDFTINALLMDTSTPDMKVIDFGTGEYDLKMKILRCVGNPNERFREDALRLLRAVRFACRFDLKIADYTWTAMQDLADTIDRVSKERIAEELRKMLLHKSNVRALNMLREVGLLNHVMPEVESHFEEVVAMLEKLPSIRSYGLVMAAIFTPLGVSARNRVIQRLKFSNDMVKSVFDMLFTQSALDRIPNISDTDLYYVLKGLGVRVFDQALALYKMRYDLNYSKLLGSIGCDENVVGEHVARRIARFRALNLPKYGGGWLLDKFQIAQGVWVKRMIDALVEEEIEGRIKDEADATLFMMKTLANGGFGYYETTGDQEFCRECLARTGKGQPHKMSCDSNRESSRG